MHFSEAADTAFVLDTGRRKISVPRFGIRDMADWTAELDAAAEAKFSADLEKAADDARERFQIKNAYRIIPADVFTCREQARTPKGILRVCETCLCTGRAKVIEENGHRCDRPLAPDEGKALIAQNEDQLPELAWALIGPRSVPPTQPAAPGEGKGIDPLTPSGTPS